MAIAASASRRVSNLGDDDDVSENDGDGEEGVDDLGKDDGASEVFGVTSGAILKSFSSRDRRDNLLESKDVKDSEKVIDDANDRIMLIKLQIQEKERARELEEKKMAFQRKEREKEREQKMAFEREKEEQERLEREKEREEKERQRLHDLEILKLQSAVSTEAQSFKLKSA